MSHPPAGRPPGGVRAAEDAFLEALRDRDLQWNPGGFFGISELEVYGEAEVKIVNVFN